MTLRQSIQCRKCGEAFETRENWLHANETCPDCFTFPDVYPDDQPMPDEFDVYLVGRVQTIPKSGAEESYFRVAARDAHEAMWFADAYLELEYDGRRGRLTDLVVDENGQANTNTNPVLSATPLPSAAWHDGYSVQKLAFRSTSADVETQRDLGPNTTDQFQHMDSDDYMDVLVHTTDEQIDHKLRENVPDGHTCYWTVTGTPRQTRFGQRIWFETDGRIVAGGQIEGVETGRIWFSPLERVDVAPPTDPPTRGFTYIEPLDAQPAESRS
ncbi:hypothetical protein [Haloarcula sp. JP-L23]|uniref:hypothetical protein n=1 Tax=Haloarcula sp. JP-L23 TaxID=2716717 RepID=UPI00140F11C1|nr:hypothetical protein G9465_24690 [Haloarcula sp. JP-L23]